MHRAVRLTCVILALGLFASPLGAQPAPAQQTDQPAPPPPPETAPLPPPPPFPPMPSAHPSHRWVDLGGRHSTRARRHVQPTHHPAARTRHSRMRAHHRSAHKARTTQHFSRKTIRSCHGMSYRQIMRHSSCRALMSQELEASAHRHHHKTHRHRATAHRARHHHAVTRRRR